MHYINKHFIKNKLYSIFSFFALIAIYKYALNILLKLVFFYSKTSKLIISSAYIALLLH